MRISSGSVFADSCLVRYDDRQREQDGDKKRLLFAPGAATLFCQQRCLGFDVFHVVSPIGRYQRNTTGTSVGNHDICTLHWLAQRKFSSVSICAVCLAGALTNEWCNETIREAATLAFQRDIRVWQ